jgi:aspartyl-tRNA(Asn)/glutamyl-tRNA(Gln) amidotransferase subunit C
MHVANLARLELSDEAMETFAGQIGDILDHVDSLQRIDTTDVAATSHAISLTNAFREDKVANMSDRDVSLANAPESEEGSFIVPKII